MPPAEEEAAAALGRQSLRSHKMPIKKRRRSAPSPPVPQLDPCSGSTPDGEEEEAVSTPASGCSLDTVMQQGLELLSQHRVGAMARMMMKGLARSSPMLEVEPQRIDDVWKEVAKKVLREMNMEFIDIDGKQAQEIKVKAASEDVEKPSNEEALLELTQALYHKLMFRKQEQAEMKIAVQQLYTRMLEAQLKLKQEESHSKEKEEQLDALGHEIAEVKSARCNLQQGLKECERQLKLAKREASAAVKEADAAKEEASAAKKETKVAEAEAIKLKREVEELKKKLANKDGAIHLLNKSITDPHGIFEKVYHDYTKLKNQLSSPPCVLNQSGTVAL